MGINQFYPFTIGQRVIYIDDEGVPDKYGTVIGINPVRESYLVEINESESDSYILDIPKENLRPWSNRPGD